MIVRRHANTWRNNFVVLLACGALLMIAYSGQLAACPVTNKHITVTANSHELTAEVATNQTGHMCGLAFRNNVPADHGMLFVYAQDQIIGFWMKNTFIPLSIAFLDSDGKILEIHDMDPLYPARRYISKSPARYALEVNQGWFAANEIKVGDTVKFNLHSDQEIFRYDHQ